VFDITGHAFYLEDGVEEGNSFEYNLGMYIKPITAKDGVPTDFNGGRCVAVDAEDAHVLLFLSLLSLSVLSVCVRVSACLSASLS
jgi:hypothetical protein